MEALGSDQHSLASPSIESALVLDGRESRLSAEEFDTLPSGCPQKLFTEEAQ
jgi:hypothetical protein